MQNNSSQVTSPWISMDLAQWDILTEGYPPTLYRKKTFLYHQNDPSEWVFIVKSGRLRITSYQENGAEKQLYIAEHGTMVGESSCLSGCNYSSSAMTIVDSMLIRVPKETLLRKMQSSWALTQSVIDLLCRKKEVLFQQMLDLSFAQSSQRIAQLLLHLCEQYGTPQAGGTCIGIRFTHLDIATMVNTSRVTVSNILMLFSKRGIISKQDGLTVVTDFETLQAIANGSEIIPE